MKKLLFVFLILLILFNDIASFTKTIKNCQQLVDYFKDHGIYEPIINAIQEAGIRAGKIVCLKKAEEEVCNIIDECYDN